MNIVTDWGPQFMSHYCRAFWSLGLYLALLSVSFQVSSPNQMVKQNGEIRNWRNIFAASHSISHPPGASSWSGLSWHLTPYVAHPLFYLHSSVNLGLSQHCSSVKK